MPVYEFECVCGNISEILLTFKELEALPRNKNKSLFTICECGGEAVQKYTAKKAIYNAPGFYGNIPTTLAHNSGAM